MPVALLVLVFALGACSPSEHGKTGIEWDPHAPSRITRAGTAALDIGSTLFINRAFAWRDGLLHIPLSYAADEPVPLLVWLHGGGGHAKDARHLFRIADDYGVVVLALDSRHNTWDGIDSPFGPDVEFIERALQYTAERVAIDPKRLALGGVSDGGSYALALGRSNGDVFSHLVGAAPWRLAPPAPAIGRPRILVVHGRDDNIYPEWHSRRFIVPGLIEEGYDVTYFAHDGPHWVTDTAAHAIMRWLSAGAVAD